MTSATENPEMTLVKSGGVSVAASWSTARKRSFLFFAGSVSARETMILSERLESRRKFMLRVISLSGGSMMSILPS